MDKKSDRSQWLASAHPGASMKPEPQVVKRVTTARRKPLVAPVVPVPTIRARPVPPPRPTVQTLAHPVEATGHSFSAQSLEIARAAVLKFAGSELKPMSEAAMVKFLKRV